MKQETAVCLAVMLVITVTKGFPANKESDNKRLIELLKNTLTSLNERSHSDGGTDLEPEPEAMETNDPELALKDTDNIEDIFTMPNNRFLQETAMARMMRPIPSISELKEFTLDSMSTKAVETLTDEMGAILTSPETFATAVTMEMIPVLLDGRLPCPSTVLHQFLMRLWDNEYRRFVSSNNKVYDQFYKTAKSVFPTLGGTDLDLYVKEAVEVLHVALFNDTYTLILAQELRDIAYATHRMYRQFFAMKDSPNDHSVVTSFTEIVESSIRKAGVRCRTGDEMAEHNEVSSWISMNDWEDMEGYDVCSFLGEFTYRYFAERVDQIPGVDVDWLDSNVFPESLDGLCDWVKDFVHQDVFTALLYYQEVINQRSTDEFLKNFGFLEPNELVVLKEVLTRLGWRDPQPTRDDGTRFASSDRDAWALAERSSADLLEFPERSSARLLEFMERSSADLEGFSERSSAELQEFPEKSLARLLGFLDGSSADFLPERSSADLPEFAERSSAALLEFPERSSAALLEIPERSSATLLEFPERSSADLLEILDGSSAELLTRHSYDRAMLTNILARLLLEDTESVLTNAGSRVTAERSSATDQQRHIEGALSSHETASRRLDEVRKGFAYNPMYPLA